MSSIADFDQMNNPYRASQCSNVAEMSEVYGDEQVAELQAFVGRNANYYLRKWAPRLESPDGDTGINWAAFFLTAFWMSYRKMYRNLAIYFAATFGIGMLTELLFTFVFQSRTTPGSANLVLNLMVSVACGGFGNAWYLEHARRKIAAARAQGLEGEFLLSVLSQRGGTSWLLIGLVFVPLLVILFLGLALAVILVFARAGM